MTEPVTSITMHIRCRDTRGHGGGEYWRAIARDRESGGRSCTRRHNRIATLTRGDDGGEATLRTRYDGRLKGSGGDQFRRAVGVSRRWAKASPCRFQICRSCATLPEGVVPTDNVINARYCNNCPIM